MQTVVTVMTVVLGIFLAEIVHQHLTATDAGLSIRCRFCQQLSADILFCHRFTLHKLIELLQIFVGIERDTHTLATITTSTTGLLIIAFQRLGDIIVNHETDIGFVDSHSESNGCHNDIDTLHQEVVLRLRT